AAGADTPDRRGTQRPSRRRRSGQGARRRLGLPERRAAAGQRLQQSRAGALTRRPIAIDWPNAPVRFRSDAVQLLWPSTRPPPLGHDASCHTARLFQRIALPQDDLAKRLAQPAFQIGDLDLVHVTFLVTYGHIASRG